MANARWRKGPPNCVGLWIVEEMRDEFYVWTVTIDRDRDGDDAEVEDYVPKPYLRFSNNETSEPINGYQWPPIRSYGPINKCRARTSRHTTKLD